MQNGLVQVGGVLFGFSFEATKLISFVEPRGEKVGCQEPMDIMYDTMDVCHGQSNQPPLLFKAPVSLTKRWQGLVGRAWLGQLTSHFTCHRTTPHFCSANGSSGTGASKFLDDSRLLVSIQQGSNKRQSGRWQASNRSLMRPYFEHVRCSRQKH